MWNFLRLSAHQLRAPVSTIQTQVRSILGGYVEGVPASVRQVLEGIDRKSRDLLNIVTEMIELARLSAGGDEVRYEPLDLEAEVVGVRDAVAMKARNKGVGLEVAIPDRLPKVWANPGSIRHVLFNLLENAVKYTPAGGRVEARLRFDRAERALLGMIRDTGIGIPAESLPKLFDEFYRASNAKREEREGTGLGLAIVKRIIDGYKGVITVASDIGQGTTFDFRIPLNAISEAELERRAESEGRRRLRIVVVGGRAAGPKAAAKALRLDPTAEISVIERERFLSYAGCGLPYFLAGKVKDLSTLMTTQDGDLRDPDFFRRVKGIAIYNRTECIAIDRSAKEVEIRYQKNGETRRLPYDKLILATGGRPIRPAIEGMDLEPIFTLNRMEDARGLRLAVNRHAGGDAVIIGGGLIGIEAAEALVACGLRVTVIEAREQILRALDPDLARLVALHALRHGVRILTGEKVVRIDGEGGAVRAVVTERSSIPASLVVVAIGVAPETSLAASAGLEIGATGGLKVNEWLQTCDPEIYAIGDCVENRDMISGREILLPLGSVANRHGRVAGTNVIRHAETFPGVVGTLVLKCFEMNIGSTGLIERTAREAGFDPLSVVVTGIDREHYYPGAGEVIVRITGDRATGRLLGVQAVGRGDVSKRIDVAAGLLSAGASVDTLSKLDLGYAPPFSTPMDVLTTAANVYKNKLHGRFPGISAAGLKTALEAREEMILVDVRNPDDYAESAIPGALSIPLRSLRGRLYELPREKRIVLYCGSGLNAYEASQILLSQNFTKVEVLEGGLAAWPYERA